MRGYLQEYGQGKSGYITKKVHPSMKTATLGLPEQLRAAPESPRPCGCYCLFNLGEGPCNFLSFLSFVNYMDFSPSLWEEVFQFEGNVYTTLRLWHCSK